MAKASEHPLPFAKDLALWALKCANLRDGEARCPEGGGGGGRELRDIDDTFRNQDLRRQVRGSRAKSVCVWMRRQTL